MLVLDATGDEVGDSDPNFTRRNVEKEAGGMFDDVRRSGC